MSTAQALSMFEERAEPGLAASLALAAAVHLLLLLILFIGVRWQNRPPEVMAVELWSAPPVAEAPAPPPPAPAAVPEPPKPEPVIEKPDIAIQEPPKPKPKPEAPKPKPEPPKPKVEPPKAKPAPAKPAAKPEPPRPSAREQELQKKLREEAAREEAALAASRERELIREQLAREASAARQGAIAGWVDKVRAKIRGNILLPPDLKGNPEAIFDVVQLPTGEVLSAKLRKSSGYRGYDEAVERAILKSSPLPRPDRPDLFVRNLELKFRPLD